MIEQLNKNSRIVAYLRKSRDDVENDDVLSKHRLQLTEFIVRNGFKNVEFMEEIGSAESIVNRPIFLDLLQKVEAGKFDAVLVVAFDRLTRGSQREAGIISETFKDSQTLIVTPSRTYDLNEESSELLSEFESLLARQEYRQIKKRMKMGKINGTKEGRHTNGKPPFPFYYDRNTRTVEIDEEKRKIYDYLLSLFLVEGLSTQEIAKRFNQEGIPTISGKRTSVWYQSQVTRLLKQDFHLGFVTHGKYVRINDRMYDQEDVSKIIKVKGLHQPIKTEEQHAIIIQRLNETYMIPHRARKGEYNLSGIMKCAFCGYGLSWFVEGKKTDIVYLKKCRHILPDGISRCNENRGISENIILDALRIDLEDYSSKLFDIQDQPKSDGSGGRNLLALQSETIDKSTERIERIKELYIDGIIDRKEFEKRKRVEESKIQSASMEVERLSQSSEFVDEVQRKERLKRWNEIDLKRVFEEDLSVLERNELFKKLIERIEYKRQGDSIEINVFYK